MNGNNPKSNLKNKKMENEKKKGRPRKANIELDTKTNKIVMTTEEETKAEIIQKWKNLPKWLKIGIITFTALTTIASLFLTSSCTTTRTISHTYINQKTGDTVSMTTGEMIRTIKNEGK